MEKIAIELLTSYGYIILFGWAMIEGETGLVVAGVLSHTGHMDLTLSIVSAGLGAFAGDQIYYYVGRSGKKIVQRKLITHRRKFALARRLLTRYGWFLIFLQRYMYGLRTVIPMTIGIVGFDKTKFAVINLVSAFAWAAIGIVLSYLFGAVILKIVNEVERYWYYSIPVAALMLLGTYAYIYYATKKKH